MEDEMLSAEDAAMLERTETIYMQQRTVVSQGNAPTTSSNMDGSTRSDEGDGAGPSSTIHRSANARFAPYNKEMPAQAVKTKAPMHAIRCPDQPGSSRSFQHVQVQPAIVIPDAPQGPQQQHCPPAVAANGGAGGGMSLSHAPHSCDTNDMNTDWNPLPKFPSIEAFKEYQKLVTQVLDKTDIEWLAGKRIVKRSGWRKLALAFGVSFELRSEEILRDDNGNVIYAKFTQRAILPGGRFSDGWGACDHREKKFAKPNHDVPATAETRAKNRACADLFGIGDAKR